MTITIISVGKIKEKYLVEGIKEYSKRLRRYTRLNFITVNDYKAPEKLSQKEKIMIQDKEGEKILKRLPDGYIIALDLKGVILTSTELASKFDEITNYHNSHIVFVIGGSLGLSKAVLDSVNLRLSFSKFTFPHQLMKLILLEQIYRSFRINNNEPYHK
ncbi:MAG: 23S rRNA (pseudouridine(1915)-N(3))-methyltransferase RlmH [Candidatus Izimaplasma sp.]|nr:23S rRNA (pseudouridine(1915)-N(3))-methyltransferase RlmH [Candidatus Izimaplasma bacterium]